MAVIAFDERPVVFSSNGQRLVGIVAVPAQPRARGVIIVVGGPQYRVGSHRQFTLLCRYLAGEGIATLRFDYHGLGDSEGPPALGVDGLADDLRCAVNTLMEQVAPVQEVVLWGLCGAASAAALYAPGDSRVVGVAMLNPSVRTEQGGATAQLRYYYLERLTSPALWQRLLRGEVDLASSLRDLWLSLRKAAGLQTVAPVTDEAMRDDQAGALTDRVLDALLRAPVRVLVILSGSDLTAKEFLQVASGSRQWRQLMASPRVVRREIPEANHTFAKSEWRAQVAEWTADWVKNS